MQPLPQQSRLSSAEPGPEIQRIIFPAAGKFPGTPDAIAPDFFRPEPIRAGNIFGRVPVVAENFPGRFNYGRAGFFSGWIVCGQNVFSGLIRPERKTARFPARDPRDASVGDLPPGRPGGPRENSGTTEPVTVPVVPLFPNTPKSEVIIRKNKGAGTGICRGLSTGMDEVIFSRIWMAEVRAG